MGFHSILFEDLESGRNVDSEEAPEFFKDLNLDQVVQAITEGWKDYNLAPFFYVRLHELDAISYRQEVMRDFDDARLMEAVKSFSAQMRAMRERLEASEGSLLQVRNRARLPRGGRDLLPSSRAVLTATRLNSI